MLRLLATVLGGWLVGVGFILIFRHGARLGPVLGRSSAAKRLLKQNAITRTAFNALQSVLLSAGATAQFEEHPLGRIARNIETFVVHAGHDRTAQIIGQAQLGATFDSTLQR